MIFEVRASNQYRRDFKRLNASKEDVKKLNKAIYILSSGGQLPKQYKDHKLKGGLKYRRECHIAPDWLLIYRKDKDQLLLLLLRTGTHRDVLGIE